MGERASVAAAVDYEEYWTLRLNGRGCLMCLPANNTNIIVKKVLLETFY